jgi:hypothetical protein
METVFDTLTTLEEKLHSAKSVASVCIGALESDYSNKDEIQSALALVTKTLEEGYDEVEKLYKLRRQFFLQNTSERTDDRTLVFPVEDNEGEDDDYEVEEENDSEAEEDHSGSDSRSAFLGSDLKVELAKEHDDGSVTYTITSDDGTLQRLFEAFFVKAMIEGIKSVEGENQKFASLKKAATELDQFLQVWENSDVLDYDPEVKEKRVALTKALYPNV